MAQPKRKRWVGGGDTGHQVMKVCYKARGNEGGFRSIEGGRRGGAKGEKTGSRSKTTNGNAQEEGGSYPREQNPKKGERGKKKKRKKKRTAISPQGNQLEGVRRIRSSVSSGPQDHRKNLIEEKGRHAETKASEQPKG